MSLLGAAAGFAGDLLDRAEGRSQASKDRRFYERWNQKQLKEAQRQFRILSRESIQRRVADATAAGLHPLYALGAAAGSPVSFAAGMPSSASGSYLGEGLSNVGRAVESAVEPYTAKGRARRQSMAAERSSARRLVDAQSVYYESAGSAQKARAARDLVEAQALASEAKRAEHAAMVSQGWTYAPGTKGTYYRGLGAAAPRKPVASVGLKGPSGATYRVGEGTPAQQLEDEYGEFSELESAFRYLRDRTWPWLAKGVKKMSPKPGWPRR